MKAGQRIKSQGTKEGKLTVITEDCDTAAEMHRVTSGSQAFTDSQTLEGTSTIFV